MLMVSRLFARSCLGLRKYANGILSVYTYHDMTTIVLIGECKGRSVDPNGVCYLGNQQNITEDVYHRLAILKEVLDRIRNDRFVESPDIDHGSKVLKIVMVPEFFLRGPFGAYSTAQAIYFDQILLDVADEIRDIVRDDFFQHYLFVFGTVIAARVLDDPEKPWWQENVSSANLGYLNFAPLVKGGSNHKHDYVVTKHYISSADFLDRTLLLNPKRSKVHQYADVSDRFQEALFEKRGTTVVENNFIQVDGLRIGIEICLDHRLGVLWDNIQTEQVKGGLVDIQLIVSAGMAIERGPNPVVPGGVVYLTDGEASSAACQRADKGPFDPDTVCRDDVAGLKHIPNGGAGYSDFFPITACIDFEKSALLDRVLQLVPNAGLCVYSQIVWNRCDGRVPILSSVD